MEDEGKERATSQFSQMAKYLIAFLLGAMLYDWADDQFDKDEEPKEGVWVFESGGLLKMNTRTGESYIFTNDNLGRYWKLLPEGKPENTGVGGLVITRVPDSSNPTNKGINFENPKWGKGVLTNAPASEGLSESKAED